MNTNKLDYENEKQKSGVQGMHMFDHEINT